MVLPGLLIEYLVVGSMALLWVLPLVGVDLSKGIPLVSVAALAPVIYVLGMFVDFVAYVLLSLIPLRKHSLKAQVRRLVDRKADIRRIKGLSGVGQ